MKFFAQTKPETVTVAASADHHNSHTAIHEALIQATVKACHHRGILSSLFPNLNNRFSRSLLLV
jgi:hypothetical protein